MLESQPLIFLDAVATSFPILENRRGGNRAYLDDWGQSTAQCLFSYRIRWIRLRSASGGIRHPLDMVKALVLERVA